jgi:hypothetical protein
MVNPKKAPKNEVYLAPEAMEEQEHLTSKRLQDLVPTKDWRQDQDLVRPPANFIDLMNWTQAQFSHVLSDQKASLGYKTGTLNKFVHNRVIIDGQFLQFCQEKNVSVECLYKDSLISWKTDHGKEKFFVQGVFLIKAKGVEFLHAALFHKGNQHEDEISFFVICSDKNQEGYVALRNQFDEWVSERDRGNLHIRVVEGDDLPYTKDQSWDDLLMEPELKGEIRGLVENFLASKDFYEKNRIPYKRGMLLFGPAGNGKTSLIRTIISCYNFKPVTIIAEANNDMVREAFAYAEEQAPALLYFEDLDSLLERSIDPSSFLNLMDGISAKNGMLVIATANEVRKLKANITDRPSRFDRKFEIPLPTADMAHQYLKKWFGSFLTAAKGKELSKYAVQHRFSYAYLKELYISTMFEALSNNRKSPLEKDINTALARLIKDKNLIKGGAINMDKYLRQ